MKGADTGDSARETATYVRDMTTALAGVARGSNLAFLAFLLEMASSEAARLAEQGDG